MVIVKNGISAPSFPDERKIVQRHKQKPDAERENIKRHKSSLKMFSAMPEKTSGKKTATEETDTAERQETKAG